MSPHSNGKVSEEAQVLKLRLDNQENNLREVRATLAAMDGKVDELTTSVAVLAEKVEATNKILESREDKKENVVLFVLKIVGYVGIGMALVSSPDLIGQFAKLLGH